jgi:hypothetical protein
MNISVLIGKTITHIERTDETLIFTCSNGDRYKMYHQQECCEYVYIEDIVGELSDLIGTPIMKAEETTNSEYEDYTSRTWTFYKFATVRGYVDIRWLGESNGYYSEAVDFEYLGRDDDAFIENTYAC